MYKLEQDRNLGRFLIYISCLAVSTKEVTWFKDIFHANLNCIKEYANISHIEVVMQHLCVCFDYYLQEAGIILFFIWIIDSGH